MTKIKTIALDTDVIDLIGEGGGGIGAGLNVISIYDDSVFKHSGSVVSFDNGLYVSTSGTVTYINSSGTSGGGGGGSGLYAIQKPTASRLIGQTGDRNTASSYNVQVCPVFVNVPMWINAINWYIRITGTYFIEVFENDIITPQTRILTGMVDASVAATQYTIPIPETLLNAGNSYYFKMNRIPTGTTNTWSDNNKSISVFAPFIMQGIWYAGANGITGSAFDFTGPISFNCKVGLFTVIP